MRRVQQSFWNSIVSLFFQKWTAKPLAKCQRSFVNGKGRNSPSSWVFSLWPGRIVLVLHDKVAGRWRPAFRSRARDFVRAAKYPRYKVEGSAYSQMLTLHVQCPLNFTPLLLFLSHLSLCLGSLSLTHVFCLRAQQNLGQVFSLFF